MTPAKCCLQFPGVGSIPPDFLTPFNFTGVTSAPDYAGTMHSVNSWDGGSGFKYWTDVTSREDIQFQEGFGLIQWNFGPMNDAPQPASLFVVPDNCLGSCDGPSGGKVIKTTKKL